VLGKFLSYKSGVIKISTRGFIGTKKKGVITGYYNHSDSYYSYLGKKVVENYFSNKSIIELKEANEVLQEGNLFLYDGLYCEYGYIHNLDNDTLEVYRGFFLKPQIFTKCYDPYDKKYYTHLVFVIDKAKHTLAKAKKAMLKSDEEDYPSENYPERSVINVCNYCYKNIPIGEEYCGKECKEKAFERDLLRSI